MVTMQQVTLGDPLQRVLGTTLSTSDASSLRPRSSSSRRVASSSL